jgi:hypothetical protein
VEKIVANPQEHGEKGADGPGVNSVFNPPRWPSHSVSPDEAVSGKIENAFGYLDLGGCWANQVNAGGNDFFPSPRVDFVDLPEIMHPVDRRLLAPLA